MASIVMMYCYNCKEPQHCENYNRAGSIFKCLECGETRKYIVEDG